MKRRILIATLLFLAATAAHAQPSPAIRQRIDSFIAAFNGSADAFEQYAQTAFTPEAFARGDAAKRRRMAEQVKGDFGKLSVRGVDRASDTRLEIAIEGSTDARGSILLDIEAAPPHRITGLAFRLGGGAGGEDRPKLAPVPVRATMKDAEIAKELDSYVGKLAGEGRFAGTVLVAKNGKAIFERAYGLANRADDVANTSRTRHNLGSINKQFTKVAIEQLAAAGKLAVEDPLGKYLPEHANADARKATISQLLDHSAGLADFFGPDFRKAEKSAFRSNSDYYAFVAPRPLTFAPGTRKQYCNACYITLGEIITRVSGMPYERYVEQNILEPAGMDDTGFFHSDHVVPRIAIGYADTPEGLRNNLYMRGAAGSAAGGAFATAEDLLSFDNALRNGKLCASKGNEVSGYAGGSGGINASVTGNGQWTVIAMANISPPAAESLTEAIFSALSAQ